MALVVEAAVDLFPCGSPLTIKFNASSLVGREWEIQKPK